VIAGDRERPAPPLAIHVDDRELAGLEDRKASVALRGGDERVDERVALRGIGLGPERRDERLEPCEPRGRRHPGFARVRARVDRSRSGHGRGDRRR